MNTHYEPSGNIDLARTAIGLLIAMVLIVPVSFMQWSAMVLDM